MKYLKKARMVISYQSQTVLLSIQKITFMLLIMEIIGVKTFTNDGTFMLNWGSKAIADGKFNEPAGLSIDRNDNIYVTDNNNNRIQVFTADGTFLTKFGSQGKAIGQFILPEGMGIYMKTALIYVADTGNYRIQVFMPVDSTNSAA
jgi:DNA-binding beta-propeller fold protein YncE